MLVHWIWFAHRPGLNDRDKMALLQHFRDPEDIYFADDGAFDAIGLSEEAKTALREKNLTSAEEILEACDREKLHILTCQDAAYPARLKNIADPPVVLYYKGRLPDFDGSPVIGVVGTRKASAYGLTTAKRMGYQIARCGGIVVSGMAYGIDGMAMSGALTAGAPAVGVLGCGADIVYPVSNRALFRDTEEYGCILSEFAPGTPPAKWTFPKRNRIISGLSDCVVVVEAKEKSGSLITADFALEQGKDVWAVPGRITDELSRGCLDLIRQGAGVAESPETILEALGISEKKAALPEKNTKILLAKEENIVYSWIRLQPASLEELVRRTGFPASRVLAVLTGLELRGLIREIQKNHYARTDLKITDGKVFSDCGVTGEGENN